MPSISKIVNFFGIFFLASNTLLAQDGLWKLNSSLSTVTGNYQNSITINDQQGTNLYLTGEYNNQWGVSAGYLSTRIGMKPISPQPSTVQQENWLLSGYRYAPSSLAAGRWTLQLDAHQIHNNTSQGDSDGVRVIAPQVAWTSFEYPLKLNLSYAFSHYKDSPTTHQISSGVGFGFNQNKNWFQLNFVTINNLDPIRSQSQTSTQGVDAKLIQFLNRQTLWAPSSITVGIERGQKFHAVDMSTQSVYNLPMINQGGENIAATWTLSSTNTLNLQVNQTRYTASQPPVIPAHDFKLKAFSAQLTHAW